ncbi:cold-shock protein [Micromonospora saelicesensis]|uniref:cold-shock protein n=1 Tax=Micromonospora saelicesensis TaxID=285676 RepID=UPI0035A22F9E
MRLSDCAADADLPLEYRDSDLDEKFKVYIASSEYPARAFVNFLSHIIDIVSSAFEVAGEVERVGRSYRDVALRSVSDATDVIERAERAGKQAPFVFFACMQDAMSAVKMFAAAADKSVDDGQKNANLAAFSGAASRSDSPLVGTNKIEEDVSEEFQLLFDAAVARVMTVLREAVRQSQLPGSAGAAGRIALAEMDEVKRLIEQAGAGRMGLDEGLRTIDRLEAVGQKVASIIGIPGQPASAASRPTYSLHTGRVKWWNEVKGFGFLTPDSPGQDVFVHSSMLASGCSGLEEGQRVSFKIVELSKGPAAEEVRTL